MEDLHPLLRETESHTGRLYETVEMLEWKGSGAKVPHLIMVTCHEFNRTPRLLYGEVALLVWAMNIRLHQEEYRRYHTAPVGLPLSASFAYQSILTPIPTDPDVVPDVPQTWTPPTLSHRTGDIENLVQSDLQFRKADHRSL